MNPPWDHAHVEIDPSTGIQSIEFCELPDDYSLGLAISRITTGDSDWSRYNPLVLLEFTKALFNELNTTRLFASLKEHHED